jgi:capsular exopolysaccharide synthesis family protein
MAEQYRMQELAPSIPTNPYQALAYYTPPPPQEVDPDSPKVPLSHYLWILRRHRWKILAFVATSVLATALVSLRMKPIYESIATIDIDFEAPADVVGENNSHGTSALEDPETFIATQIKLIQSDAVLRPVVEQFHLLGQEDPNHKLSAEKLQQSASAPVSLNSLRVNRPSGTYLLQISYRSSNPRVAADVANAVANSYVAHIYNIRIRSSASLSEFMEKQLDELKAKMEESNLALAKFEKDLNVVNPEEKTNILSARLMQLNTDYTNAQSERVAKEAAYNAMKSGSLEAAQVSTQGESLAKLNDQLNQARQRFALVKATYGSNHPEYKKAASELAEIEKQFADTRTNIAERIAVQYREALNREQILQKAVAATKGEWDSINSNSFQYQQLKREADADKALYDELIRKIREANINAGFQNNNIRIADVARPAASPVFPNLKLNLLFALFISTLLATAVAIIHDSLDTTLRDPEEAGRFLGVDVIGAMPVDRSSAMLPGSAGAAANSSSIVPRRGSNAGNKASYRATSDFDEAMRTVRNTILLSDFDGRLRSIMLTSATPAEGKSTVAAHLAIANADRGKKTLLVDGDLRRPSLHSKFGLNPSAGLSSVLNGEVRWQDVVLPIEGKPNLFFLPSGPGSHRAADLVGPRLSSLLDEFGKEYDLVILDSPPLLGFAECLQMATAADGVLIVSLAGETKRKTVAAVVSTLRRLRANILGVVLNQVSQNTSADGYSYYGYYKYGYGPDKEP